ncbi:MAG: MarR family winged helix-turn-helix transcriptional regulator [Oscillospiraceae bacterium]|nr:MarR family winged helix-turn-helix transcriptional regulator [Oscillospiraceae bacterium]
MVLEYYKDKAWELVRIIKAELTKAVTPILHESGLSEHQVAILMAISEGDFHSVSKLAELLNANQGNFSVACKKLEQLGLVVRKRSKEDERVVELELTKLGTEKVTIFRNKLEEMFKQAEATPQQLESIISGCNETITLLKKINRGNSSNKKEEITQC